jgi:8-oxo-dGTP pyrophosphatase MutT (NUDIX family)
MVSSKSRPFGEVSLLRQLAGGRADAGETTLNAARRELEEETGIKAAESRFKGLPFKIPGAGQRVCSSVECADSAELVSEYVSFQHLWWLPQSCKLPTP